MTDHNRRTGLTEEELAVLAEKLSELIIKKHGCPLSDEQQAEVFNILATKKRAVKVTLYVIGAIVIWVLKDIYSYVIQHLNWGK